LPGGGAGARPPPPPLFDHAKVPAIAMASRLAIDRRVILMAGWLAIAAPLSAQQPFPPKSFQNLQVLPKDAPATLVITTMKGFANNLGVRCQHCHVGEEGMPLEQFDFVSDAKPAKNTARVMMRLLRDINAQLDTSLPTGASASRVMCVTCHRGKAKPTNIREP
jgi:hypothetical protein